MYFKTKEKIFCEIENIANIMITHSSEAPSRRIVGQYGSEIWQEQFTEIVFYLHCSTGFDQFNEIKEIIDTCINDCQTINRNYLQTIRFYLFDEKKGLIKQINAKLFQNGDFSGANYFEEFSNFIKGINVKPIQNLERQILRVDDNGLVVFITDVNGCDLDVKKLNDIKHKSIWFKLEAINCEVVQGIPRLKLLEYKESESKGAKMKVWLHRISHWYSISSPLLEQGYLTIGFADYIEKFNKYSDLKMAEENFEVDMLDIYKKKSRQRLNLHKFLYEFKKGDRVLVPLWGEFSVYEIIESARPMTELPKEIPIKANINTFFDNDGLLSIKATNEEIDLGFFIQVKPILTNIPRDGYCDTKLIYRMKIRNATADISDLEKEVDTAIARFKNDNPINFHYEAINAIKENFIETILQKLTDSEFEKLVKWYLEKIGATEVFIPSKNETGKSDFADADVVATFELLKCIVYVQVKHHNGYTSDWAVHQIARYKEQKEDLAVEYTYLSWVLSSGEFSEEVNAKAKSEGVRLIDKHEFSEMLIDLGLEGINEAFTK